MHIVSDFIRDDLSEPGLLVLRVSVCYANGVRSAEAFSSKGVSSSYSYTGHRLASTSTRGIDGGWFYRE